MRYPLDPDFARYAWFRIPLNPAAIRLGALTLGVLPGLQRSDEKLTVTRHEIPVADGETIPALLFRPAETDRPMPALLDLHGGVFAFKAAPHHFRLARAYAALTPCVVLLPDYRLLPRHRFPVQTEDAYSSLLWLRDKATQLGIDPSRIAVGGDSAGGNLAAAVCLMARDRQGPTLHGQLLIYPGLDRRMQTPSARRYTDTPIWNTQLNEKMWRLYLPNPSVPDIAYASPLEASSLHGLPNAYIETAEFDPLHDEALLYADKLREAGCEVEVAQTRGTMHGFDWVRKSRITEQSVTRRVRFLRETLR